MRWLVASLSLSVLVSCTGVKQGPPVELAEFTVPTVVSAAAKATAPPPPPPVQAVSQGTIKAWKPPEVAANGDRHDGHYVFVSRSAPKDERTPPPYVIPTAPKVLARPQPKKTTTAPAESKPSPTALQESYPQMREPMQQGAPDRLPLPLPQEGPYVQPVP